MDGVPHITQDPIQPGATFAYQFVAIPSGSHMYHSHHNATDQVGRGFPATQPLTAKLNETIVVRFMNEGVMMHPWHLHGMPMNVVARDGYPLGSAAFTCDTLGVNPGERWDVVIRCDNPGAWAFHCHILPHAEGQHGMFGMVTALIVTP